MSHRAAVLSLSLLVLTVGTRACAQNQGGEPPLDPIMGEFEGTFTPAGGQAVKAEAKVVADQDNKYRLSVLYPAADAKATRLELPGLGKGNTVSIDSGDWSGTVGKDALGITAKDEAKAEMKRIERKSPTLGQKPPAGCWSCCLSRRASRPTWTSGPRASGLARPTAASWPAGPTSRRSRTSAASSCTSSCACRLCPPPVAKGAAIAGSTFMGGMSIQVLDSFGLPLTPFDCAAIYGVKAPDFDAALRNRQ